MRQVADRRYRDRQRLSGVCSRFGHDGWLVNLLGSTRSTATPFEPPRTTASLQAHLLCTRSVRLLFLTDVTESQTLSLANPC